MLRRWEQIEQEGIDCERKVNKRAGDSVWDLFQLAAGGGLLDWEDDGVVLRKWEW